MPIYYRGAGVDSYWYRNDARLTGFIPHHPAAGGGISRILNHSGRGTTASPYVSLTRSYAIARGYALGGRRLATIGCPGYVYEVEIEENDGCGTRLIDPVQEVVKTLGSPYDHRSYHHDGDAFFLLGIVDPLYNEPKLYQPVRYPPQYQGTPRTPRMHIELEAMVRALRDAEILAFGSIAATQVRARFEIQ